MDVLSELLYCSEVEDLFLCDFEVDVTAPTSVHVRTGGVDAASVELTGPPIKAVTHYAAPLSGGKLEGWTSDVSRTSSGKFPAKGGCWSRGEYSHPMPSWSLCSEIEPPTRWPTLPIYPE